VDKSDHKACFVLFCFEYKRFIEFKQYSNIAKFSTDLPRLLEASCNGYQYISLLTREKKALKHLNLVCPT